ncbi:hypothetical protein BC835DRAFT_1212865, partial [Cytidiella melzeri]
TCTTCHERGFERGVIHGECLRCRNDKRGPAKKFSDENGMNPASVRPLCLQNLTKMEEMLISPVLPIMQVRYTKGRQLCYRDHVVNFPQDISAIAAKLPRLPEETDTVIIRRDSLDMSRHIDFIVRRDKVRAALEYKIAHDPNYASFVIDKGNLSQLPQNGSVVHRISTCPIRSTQTNNHLQAPGPAEAAGDIVDDIDDINFEDVDDNHEQRHNGVLNLGTAGRSEIEQLTAPQLGGVPINESTPGYIVKAFPTLFPDGRGDYYQPRVHKVELGEYFSHLMLFEDGCFARHRRFPWFAFNTLQRHRSRNQSRIFIQQQHDAAGLTAAEIRAML